MAADTGSAPKALQAFACTARAAGNAQMNNHSMAAIQVIPDTFDPYTGPAWHELEDVACTVERETELFNRRDFMFPAARTKWS